MKISFSQSVGLARLLNDETFFFKVLFHLHMNTTLQKVPSNAVSIRKAISHAEVAINDIRENLAQVRETIAT
jgi:hypothetical protein